MYILGVSNGGESGAALFKDNKLLCASNEERFSRIKLDSSFPKHSIMWCLQFANIKPEDIALITYGFSSGDESSQNKSTWINTLLSLDPKTLEGEIIRDRILSETEVDKTQYNLFHAEIKELFLHSIPIIRYNHHFSHVACAFVASGMDQSMVVTADGRGDYRSISIGIATIDGFQEIYTSPSWHSLGYFYGRMTKLCGFTPNRHEGKVTGLAAFGDPKKALPFVKKMISYKDGKILANIGEYYRPFFSNYSKKLIDEAKNFSSEDLAAATQYYFEEMFVKLISFYIKKTGMNNICLAGGIFSNIKLNQKIYEINQDVDIFVYPNMGDGGICVGSCYAWIWENKKITLERISSMYLGYELNKKSFLDILKTKNFLITQPEDISKEIVSLLKDGHSVGLSQGRTEFGPRALGNRTILASPQNNTIIQKINKQLGRDTFMPLAPIMPLELTSKFLIFKNSNSFNKGFFMTMTYDSKPNLKTVAEAIVHVDGTVRPQFVDKENNAFLHNLLMSWYEHTGCPCLINTSFNSHEEPIVNNEEDIISAFDNKVVDYLVFPPYLIEHN